MKNKKNDIHVYLMKILFIALSELTYEYLLLYQLPNFEGVLQPLSQRAPNLKTLFIGCNPFSSGRPLSLHSALLSLGHVDIGKAHDLLRGLRKYLLSVSSSGSDLDVEKVVKTLCQTYSPSHDYERLLSVGLMLVKLRQLFPNLVSVDNEELTES